MSTFNGVPLYSPALFAGYDNTPKHAIEQFVNLSLDYGFIFPLLYVSLRSIIYIRRIR